MARNEKIKIRTPRGKVITRKTSTGEVKARLEWNPAFGSMMTDDLTKAQEFVDSEVLRLCDPLTPMRSRELIMSGQLGTDIGSGEVRYLAVHSRYQYYGKVMVGKAPKKVTDIPLTYEGAPARGSKWFERMKAQSKDDILKGAAKYANAKPR